MTVYLKSWIKSKRCYINTSGHAGACITPSPSHPLCQAEPGLGLLPAAACVMAPWVKPPAGKGALQSLCPRLRAVPVGKRYCLTMEQDSNPGACSSSPSQGHEAPCAEPAGTNTLSLTAVWGCHGEAAATRVTRGHHLWKTPKSLMHVVPPG